MSFHAPPTPPTLTRRQIRSINSNLKPLVEVIRGPHARFRERALLRMLKGSRFLVFSAIVSRTLGWKNIVDILTLGQLERGFPGDGGRQQWIGGLPKFSGTGLTNKTLIAALAKLEQDGVIARFRVPDENHGEIHAFAPMSVWTLCEVMTAMAPRRVAPPPPPWLQGMIRVDASGKPRVTPLERAFTAYLTRPPSTDDGDDAGDLDRQE